MDNEEKMAEMNIIISALSQLDRTTIPTKFHEPLVELYQWAIKKMEMMDECSESIFMITGTCCGKCDRECVLNCNHRYECHKMFREGGKMTK